MTPDPTGPAPNELPDERLDALLNDAAANWRVAPPVPDALWNDITGALDSTSTDASTSRVDGMGTPAPLHLVTSRRTPTGPSWRMVGLAAAACLTIGVLLGRVSRAPESMVAISPTPAPAATPSIVAPASATTTAPDNDPAQRLTEDLLARTATLLASLPNGSRATARDPQLADQAARLLTTTRVLLDAPTGDNRRMRALLEDLELVLVQVARLRAPRASPDLSIIQAAVAERDLVPRLRSAVATLSGGSDE